MHTRIVLHWECRKARKTKRIFIEKALGGRAFSGAKSLLPRGFSPRHYSVFKKLFRAHLHESPTIDPAIRSSWSQGKPPQVDIIERNYRTMWLHSAARCRIIKSQLPVVWPHHYAMWHWIMYLQPHSRKSDNNSVINKRAFQNRSFYLTFCSLAFWCVVFSAAVWPCMCGTEKNLLDNNLRCHSKLFFVCRWID